ncbi:uncharacterized protein [Procambarus clarkii]|uniref:uncharacterized protein n=1 Tax=Procambarus clarkii TaxID=6728 RepID=UPI0037426FAB
MFEGGEENEFRDIPITCEVITKNTDKLNKLKSLRCGWNPIQSLKELAEELCLPLKLLFTKSLDQGVIPLDWKYANVIPNFPKRQIELSRKLLADQLVTHLQTHGENPQGGIGYHLSINNLVQSTQHGFVKNTSCLTNLLRFLEMVSSYSDNGLPVDVDFAMDLAKAFDKASHERQQGNYRPMK